MKSKLTSPTYVRRIMKEMNLRPRRSLGQNFLIDANIVEFIINAAAVSQNDAVLEIGAGLGVLSEALAARKTAVIAVEKDPRLADHLASYFAGIPNITLIHGDILDLDLPALITAGHITRVVSNLPYSVASRILVRLAQLERPVPRMVVTIQKDVAERLVARPGTSAYGVLTILMGAVYTAQRLKVVSPHCFVPVPRIDSAVVLLMHREYPICPRAHRKAFRDLVRTAFTRRRKKLSSLLRDHYGLTENDRQRLLKQAGVPPDARPENVSITAWAEMAGRLSTDESP